MMRRRSVAEIADKLFRFYKEDCHDPFPYADSRKLLREDTERYDNLIAHLDLYFYEIASHCGGVQKILKWPSERLRESQQRLRASFFDRHPEYRVLESSITKSNTPKLHAALTQHESMRNDLLGLLSLLLAERE